MDATGPSGAGAGQPSHHIAPSSDDDVLASLEGEFAKPGRLAPPYPCNNCSNAACERPLSGSDGAYLYRDLRSGALTIFCDDCARHVELNFPQTFILAAL